MSQIDRKIAERLNWKFYLEQDYWSGSIDHALVLVEEQGIPLIMHYNPFTRQYKVFTAVIPETYRGEQLSPLVAAAILAWLEAKEAER